MSSRPIKKITRSTKKRKKKKKRASSLGTKKALTAESQRFDSYDSDDGVVRHYDYKSPSLSANMVMFLCGFLAVGLITDIVLRSMAITPVGSDEEMYMHLGLLVFAIAGFIAFVVWAKNCNNNLHAFECDKLEFTPQWTIGWLMMPVVHFFMPVKIIDELWHRSWRLKNDDEHTTPYFVWTWWIVFMSAIVLSFFLVVTADLNRDTVEATQNAIARLGTIYNVFGGIHAVCLIACIVLVKKITRLQAAHHIDLEYDAR